MKSINIAIVGIGNCASSLIQGLSYYRGASQKDSGGLMHWDLGGYTPESINVVAAFDIDKRKVGNDVTEAIFAAPNNTTVFCKDIKSAGVPVIMGALFDGVADHMASYPEARRFMPASLQEPTQEEVVALLKNSKADMLLNYLPVGSEKASRFYAECALEAEIGFINNIPVFIASDPVWAKKFEDKGLPIIGDDIKAQMGATITHRVLTDLFAKRGVTLDRTYQLNTGGNTDFLNMLDHSRLASKKTSKTEAVQSVAATRLEDENIHVGPSDYVAWQNDNKVCFLRMEGRLFGDVPMNLEMRLSVEDSPNSAGVAIDSIRCLKIALDRGIGGVLHSPSSYFCKHPAQQVPDADAHQLTEDFISGKRSS